MRKNLMLLITLTAMLASVGVVSAESNEVIEDSVVYESVETEDAAITSENTDVESVPSYISYYVNVTEISDNIIETVRDGEDSEDQGNIINYTVFDNTLVFDLADGEKKSLSDIKEGDILKVFTSSSAPAPLILPIQYQADVIIIGSTEAEGFVDVDTYASNGDMLVNAANTLALNIDEETVITDTDGNDVFVDELENKNLIVFYGASTKSIPAQTAPEKIVVINTQIEDDELITDSEAEDVIEEILVDFTKIKTVKFGDDETTNIYNKEDGTLMLPLRKLAEDMGFTVDWDGENRAVILNSGIYSLTIDENNYIKGRMMRQQLSCAPEITDDLTYVPIDYFSEILEAQFDIDMTNEDYVLTLTMNASTDISE